jgi:hypothetical protein
MKSLIIVLASLGAVVITFPLQKQLKFKSSPLPLMNIDHVPDPNENVEEKPSVKKSSAFVKALPFSRQSIEVPIEPVVQELKVGEAKASPHSFILRGITGVGDKKRAMIMVEGGTDSEVFSYTYEDKISDSGYVIYEIHDDHVVLDHSIYSDVILSFDYDTDFSASMQKKAGDLEQKTQKEITKIYQKKAGVSSKSKKTQDSKMWEERKKRYEQFRKMRESQEKSKEGKGDEGDRGDPGRKR